MRLRPVEARPAPDRPYVDAHHHVWDVDRFEYPFLAPEFMAPIRRTYGLDDLRSASSTTGVSATVAVQTLHAEAETRDLLAIAEASGGLVAGVVGWVDLTRPDVGDALARLQEAPGGERLVGIRHLVQSEADPDWLLRPDVRRGLQHLATAGLAFDLGVTAGQLPGATRLADLVPCGRYVLDHAGRPPIAAGEMEPWASDLRALARRENVSCKLSGLATQAEWSGWTVDELAPYAEVVLDAFGPGRMMAGSDWPVCELAGDYQTVWGAIAAMAGGLTQSEQTQVLASTATEVYRLPRT
jgi:L-fuconolactonase